MELSDFKTSPQILDDIPIPRPCMRTVPSHPIQVLLSIEITDISNLINLYYPRDTMGASVNPEEASRYLPKGPRHRIRLS